MCGRIARVRDDVEAEFGVVEIRETRVTPRFNIAPTQLDLIIRPEADGRRLVASRWGLIPSWAKDRSIGSKTFNARAETLPEKPAFRSLVARQRCIVPASGFYEWTSTPAGRQPCYIHRADGASLALAGLWAEWIDRESGALVTSHTVITCQANGFMAAYHQRMPVILDGPALAQWLDPAVTEPADVLPLLGPCPDDTLDCYAVGPLVNNARQDGPELLRRVAG